MSGNNPNKFGAAPMPQQMPNQQSNGGGIYGSGEIINADLGAMESVRKYIYGMNQQAANTANRLSGEIGNMIGELKVADALGFKNGFFDIPANMSVGETIIKKAADTAHKAYEDGILGAMLMANGKTQEGMALYSQARQQGDSQLNMMQRVSDQYKVLHSPDASEAEKAMARTNLGKAVGNRQELVQSIQALMPGLAQLSAAKVSTEAAKAQTIASSYGPLANLIGLESQRWGSLISANGQNRQDLDDLVKAQSNIVTLLGYMIKDDQYSKDKNIQNMLNMSTGITDYIGKQHGFEQAIDANSILDGSSFQGQR